VIDLTNTSLYSPRFIPICREGLGGLNYKQMKVVILGAGNVATHLSIALQGAGHQIVQVFSKTTNSAAALAEKLVVPFTIHSTAMHQDADVYFYAVSDAALPSLLALDIAPGAIHVHTAGSVAMDVFKGKKQCYGVFYPLQTFSKDKSVNFKKVPVFLEASDSQVEQLLVNVAESVAGQVYKIDSTQRMQLHIAAVFASNFVNHMYQVASDLVQKSQLSFDVLKPLIIETADKINYLSPKEAQTGPAKRNDIDVIDSHLSALSESDDLTQLYRLLSQMIFDKQLHQS